MKLICCVCKKQYGNKGAEPGETHGYCKPCLKKAIAEAQAAVRQWKGEKAGAK